MERKTVYLKSFGCQMNDADSEQILGILKQSGYQPVDRPDEADLILLNTCSIRAKAEQKVFSDLGRLKVMKIKDPSVKIGVAGCMAQSMGERILGREPAVDFVFGTSGLVDLPDLIEKAGRGEKGISLARSGNSEELRSEAALRSSLVYAYVPIIYGCGNFCSYCVVPYVRGPETSRPVQRILKEIRDLAGRGYKEVTLLGQNVLSYGKKGKENIMFNYLLHLIHDIDGIERIRFVTSHPRDMTQQIVETMAGLPKVCESLHLPVQSGSDKILYAMNRGYTKRDYLEKLRLLREKIHDIAITTDMIVGFPGETDKDFEETLSLISEGGFDHLFGFCFSPRPGTPAGSLPDPVDAETARVRLSTLFKLQKEISLKKNREMVGKKVEVLVEGAGKKDPKQLSGRTRTNKVVHFPGGKNMIGKLVQVRIEQGLPNCLIGTAVQPVTC
ncbi:MAG: tRNA (N6-isopentenyl adenosine(37)-C2)-methylthiotransferase MiaB [Nitrospirae bacterium CG_4_9_14_3_um_filter_53_35]|nr:MAG: tRNA (N6-isopentenyl adenosine(37)-C2)-methylthiotransferase MiaB [Nitrospirae bacterium CG08_land_8_20_14_0_20_52_24]PIW86096.1 MAG: tRNA (N6-isopentenyl adenosine(37)-C2)-methylthiotransferase MiaB [Nitrospirae bacterium CG_4_8_14_3_um_filter_50_41]PIX84782.1 MAG: tRNA (N6-isopentenyl adenosine(37)-C2)-methylthiotransferase MiaB [Nitrospirae bacterium CG_4_10_14_3_um_filter_53_41]PJA72721.1 MAG: tRNA (N6-isopentenyl adenosine(37)-C2)-methylthiotransferase MiaB [Nitrospirae bacterium CG